MASPISDMPNYTFSVIVIAVLCFRSWRHFLIKRRQAAQVEREKAHVEAIHENAWRLREMLHKMISGISVSTTIQSGIFNVGRGEDIGVLTQETEYYVFVTVEGHDNDDEEPILWVSVNTQPFDGWPIQLYRGKYSENGVNFVTNSQGLGLLRKYIFEYLDDFAQKRDKDDEPHREHSVAL